MFICCTGSIFDMTDIHTWVNPVNCVGVSGKGLALEFKKRFPENFNHYRRRCDNKYLKIGRLLGFTTPNKYKAPRYIINLPTKIHWKDSSDYSYIKKGAWALGTIIIQLDIKSIVIPALGCGLGGLTYERVQAILIDTLLPFSIGHKIVLLEPEWETKGE